MTADAAEALGLDHITEFNVEDVDDLTPMYERVRAMLVATGEAGDADGKLQSWE